MICLFAYAFLFFLLQFIQEKHASEIVLKAMGQAISKTVAIAEILKVKFFYKILLLGLRPPISFLKFMEMAV